MVLSVFWALLPVVSLGLLTPILAPIPFAHAAIRLRNRMFWFFSAAYGIISLTLWILFAIAIEDKWKPADGVNYAILSAVGVLASVHAFRLRRRVFAPSSPPTGRDRDSARVNGLNAASHSDDVLEVAIQRLESSGASSNIREAAAGLQAIGLR
jgi:hypothetical protein